MKSESKQKEKKVKVVANRGPIDGFLIPDHFRRQSFYRHHPAFRSTLLLLIIAVLIGSIGGYKWVLAQKTNKTRNATQQMLLAESQRLQNETLLLKTTKERHQQLSILEKQLRIPLTPVLDSIEKTIPKEISINGFEFKCAPLATSGAVKRKAIVRMLVFIPQETPPSDPIVTEWPKKIFENMSSNGLKGSNPNWGAPKDLVIPKTKTRAEIRGFTRELNYEVELQPGQA